MRICIDTETTGFDPAGGDEILQLSIVDADTKQVLRYTILHSVFTVMAQTSSAFWSILDTPRGCCIRWSIAGRTWTDRR